MGWIYYKKGFTDKAIESLSRARTRAPESQVVNCHLGMAFYKAGDKARAKIYLTKAVAGKGEFAGKDEARMILGRL